MQSDVPSYPRLAARTQNFTLGVARSFVVSPDGRRVVFVRAASGTDRVHQLWLLDLDSGSERPGTPPQTAGERLVADPRSLLSGGEEHLSPAERARRERLREGGAGVVAYATDHAVEVAAFALSSRLFVADLRSGKARELQTPGGVVDPRPDPTGHRIAYVSDRSLRVVNLDGSEDRTLLLPARAEVSIGLAEFVAAEEMGRTRGFWWAPDGKSLLVTEVDEADVPVWHVANPAEPAAPPVQLHYPAAGTGNARVTLWHVTLDGERREVTWDTQAFPYLARVSWPLSGQPLLLVQSRDQRTTRLLEIDPRAPEPVLSARTLREEHDEAWLDLVPGVPTRLDDGRIVATVDDADTRRLAIDGMPVSPPGLQIRSVLNTDGDEVLVLASSDPTETHLYWLAADGAVRALTSGRGMSSGQSRGGTTVLVTRDLADAATRVSVHTSDGRNVEIVSHALHPPVQPVVRFLSLGERRLRAALLLPSGHEPGSRRLPVLMDPYGGPGAQRVIAANGAYLKAQWLADQGFAVLIVDGRGTPGRGPAWEREIRFDFAGPVLEDQVEALRAAAEDVPDLDLDRVAIRGWSFGGYLAALAVLRRPDVFHAAVAGAPVTDWRLYDTHYTERYLGLPQEHPEAYEHSSLIGDAARLERPLLLIHGLADDNVVAAHTLRLSRALLEAGRPHQVLPLSGVTHFTPQEVVAENLLRLELTFIRQALGTPQ